MRNSCRLRSHNWLLNAIFASKSANGRFLRHARHHGYRCVAQVTLNVIRKREAQLAAR